MNVFEKLEDFESQSLGIIAFNMCKWFMFDRVNVNYEPRNSVASRMWITVEMEIDSKTYMVDGQRVDIVKRRLIEWLRAHLQSVRG